jgi:trk system potassium uptake protein TrkH
MLYRDICRVLSYIFFGLTAALCVPLLLSIHYEYLADPLLHAQPHATLAFAGSILISLTVAVICYIIGKKSTGRLFRREALAIVVLIWFLCPALSALPFWFGGVLEDYWTAYFEAVSGLTTTGATTMQAKAYNDKGEEIPINRTFKGVIDVNYKFYGTIKPVRDPETGKVLFEGIEAVNKAILFWRSFLQWLGGGGIVVLVVAILPALGVGGKILFQTEVPGPIKDSLTPRITETAINLWKIYFFLSLIEFFLLMYTNPEMEWLDAVTITFSTLSTGGYSIRNASIGYYQNISTEWVVILFMFIGSLNFSLYYYALKGKFFRLYDLEFIVYVTLVLISCAMASWYLIGYANLENALSISKAARDAIFQVVSAISTTGFSTANYDFWPYVVQAVMIIAMFLGGMAGSTSGGIKTIRHILLFRIGQNKVESLFQPYSVRRVEVGEKEVDAGAMIMVLTFFLLLITVSVFGTFLYIWDGMDPSTAMGAVTCMVNNTGLAFRMAGPENSFAFMDDFALMLSSFLMILGRLEFFAVFALLVPAFWKKTG